jgi:hypothetical protein
MSKRVSSRDDLFLSMVDMYTLLSLAFIGFAFFVSPQVEQEIVELPIARRGGPSVEKLSVRWVRGPARGSAETAASGQCLIKLWGHPNVPGRHIESPCTPSAFETGRGVTEELSKLSESLGAGTPPDVVVRCSRTEGLAACASLQWLMHEAGFYPIVAVEAN